MKTQKEHKATSTMYMILFIIAMILVCIQSSYLHQKDYRIVELERDMYYNGLEFNELMSNQRIRCNKIIQDITEDKGLIVEDFISND